MLRILPIRYKITQINTQQILNPKKLATIIGPTRLHYTQIELLNQIKSLSHGLKQQRFTQGDSLLVKLSRQNLQQQLLIKCVSSLTTNNFKIHISKSKTISQLQNQLIKTQARAFIFSGYNEIQNRQIIDILYHIIPQLSHLSTHTPIKSAKYPFLKYLIQTNAYKMKGINVSTFDIRLAMYSTYNMIQYDSRDITNRPILITNPCDDLQYRCGVLQCLNNGRLLLCSDQLLYGKATQYYQHQLDVVCGEDIGNVHNRNRLIVLKDSPLYKNHPNRIQIALQQ